MSEPSSSIPYFFNVWAIPYWFTFFVSFILTVLLFYKKFHVALIVSIFVVYLWGPETMTQFRKKA